MTLVISATGMIGSHLVKELVGAGHAVRALVRDRAKAAQIVGPSVDLVVGDLSNRVSRAGIRERRPSVRLIRVPSG